MILSRESLKQQIDSLSDKQLAQIAEYISSLRTQATKKLNVRPFWQSATPQERSQDFLQWVNALHKTNLTLPDEAFDRATIYN